MSGAGRHAAEAGRRTVRRGRRPAAPVGQGEDPVDRPVEAGVFARLDDMLARHRAGRPGRSPPPRAGTGTKVKAMLRTRVSEKVLRSPMP